MKVYAIVKNIRSDGGNVSRYWLQYYNKKYAWGDATTKHLYRNLNAAHKRLQHLKSINHNININYQILDYEISKN